MMELTQLIPCPEFVTAWNELTKKWGEDPKWKGYTKMRMMAYEANATHNVALKNAAWKLLMDSLKVNGHDRFPSSPQRIEGPEVAEPVEEILPLDTPGVSQWALNVLTTMELVREFKA